MGTNKYLRMDTISGCVCIPEYQTHEESQEKRGKEQQAGQHTDGATELGGRRIQVQEVVTSSPLKAKIRTDQSE